MSNSSRHRHRARSKLTSMQSAAEVLNAYLAEAEATGLADVSGPSEAECLALVQESFDRGNHGLALSLYQVTHLRPFSLPVLPSVAGVSGPGRSGRFGWIRS